MATKYKGETALSHGHRGGEVDTGSLTKGQAVGWHYHTHLLFDLIIKCLVLVSTETWLMILVTTIDELESCCSL
jgi:hypothetical protein